MHEKKSLNNKEDNLKKFLLTTSVFLIPAISLAADNINPTPFPVFLKLGFSAMLKFPEVPVNAILGDSESFQVEKLNTSLIVRTLVPEASSNLIVHFKSGDPRIFILKASDEAKPTLYQTFESKKIVSVPKAAAVSKGLTWGYQKGTRLTKVSFDKKKDYLTIELSITADSKEKVEPRWDWVRLTRSKDSFKPEKLWSEREVVQKDSSVKARFIFKRPDIPLNLSETYLAIPVKGYASPVRIALAGKASK